MEQTQHQQATTYFTNQYGFAIMLSGADFAQGGVIGTRPELRGLAGK